MWINVIVYIILLQLWVEGEKAQRHRVVISVRRDHIVHLIVLKVVACLACWCRGITFPSPSTVIMREMAPGSNGFFNIPLLYFLRTPVPSHRWVPSHAYRCDNAIKWCYSRICKAPPVQSLRWVRCWTGKYLVLHTALPGNAAADSRQPGAISPMGRYHDGTVKDVLVHSIR